MKIVFNFKRIYMYALMHVLHTFKKKIIWLIIYIFIIKLCLILNAFMCLHELHASYKVMIIKNMIL